MNSRRALLAAIGVSLAAPRAAWAQPARQARVVVLFAGDAEDDEPAVRPFFDEMRRLGWVEDRNIAYERLSGRGMRDYLEQLVSVAADRGPDLIFATSASIALAAIKVTDKLPVVFTTTSDPVTSGLVASLARPGRNATGVQRASGNVVARRFALLKEARPGVGRIGYLLDRRAPDYERQKQAHQDAAQRAKLELSLAEFTNYEAVAKLLAGFRRDGVTVVVVGSSLTLFARRRDIGMFAARNGLALVAHRVEWADAGALLTYGADIADSLRRGARIASRILKGAQPAAIAVEQSEKFELVLNLKTAGALGLTLPAALLKRAHRVID